MTRRSDTALGLLHPGEMGATVGAAAAFDVGRVLWASDGRSAATRNRAEAAGLTDVTSVAALARESDVIVSVCPPAAALQVAEDVAKHGFTGVFVDANAVSPATARALGSVFEAGPADFVDGGIIGPPARKAGTTRLHLSGPRAAEVAACFETGPLAAHVVDGPVGAASALKMTFAAYTKGTSALLAASYAVARAEGVDTELLREWEQSAPEAPGRLRLGVPNAARKAWRFTGEMHEIAATFEAAGITSGFHQAAAEIFERLAGFRDASEPPTPEAVADRLLESRETKPRRRP